MPPTLDIIHSLGHDREAEFTESSHSEQPTGMSKYGQSTSFYVDDTDDMVVPRKKYWPRGIRSKVSTSSPVQIFNDVDLDDGEDRFSRKTYWPNDVRNDATNPIHVFDDISVRSESVNHHGVCNRSDDSIDDSNNNDDISTDSDESPEIV